MSTLPVVMSILRLSLRDLFETGHGVTHDIGRNRETQSLGWDTLRSERHFGRAHADETTGKIDHRPAAVARINRCVGLNEILYSILSMVISRRTALSTPRLIELP